MKKYKDLSFSFHTLFRLITMATDVENFAIGVARLYKNIFKADKVLLVYKTFTYNNSYAKIRMFDKKQYIKIGGLSILTKREREILNQGSEIVLNKRLIYPFIFNDILGAIYIKRNPKNIDFTSIEEKWFMSFSEMVTMGFKIFNLYQEEKKIILNYIKYLSNLLSQYVPTSSIHTKIAFRLVKAMSTKLKISEIEKKSLEYACLLHDAGKIELPSKLLEKQTPLTHEELKQIRKHPRKGIRLIKDLEILKPVIPIILHHHERYDGKGYPSKLKKEQIPLCSRILAVLDAFDAMYFGRPYRKSKDLDEIKKEFREKMGTQFDPKIVNIFLKILEKKSIKKLLL